jgi:hypothetical protein
MKSNFLNASEDSCIIMRHVCSDEKYGNWLEQMKDG